MPIKSSIFIELFKSNRQTIAFFFALVLFPIVGTILVSMVMKTASVASLRTIPFSFIPFIYLIASGLLAFGLLPTTMLAYVSGFLWGWKIVPFMVMAYALAQWMGYITAKKTGVDGFMNSLLSLGHYESKLKMLKKIDNQWVLVFFCRLSPILPFGIMNFVLSMLQIRLNTFLIAGLLGMLPRTLFFIWVGIESETLLNSPQTNWLEKGIGLAISLFSFFVIMKIVSQSIAKIFRFSDKE